MSQCTDGCRSVCNTKIDAAKTKRANRIDAALLLDPPDAQEISNALADCAAEVLAALKEEADCIKECDSRVQFNTESITCAGSGQ